MYQFFTAASSELLLLCLPPHVEPRGNGNARKNGHDQSTEDLILPVSLVQASG